jgi:hypothetical protein
MARGIVREKMKAANLPMTREQYLALTYMGNPPQELSAKEEAELPLEFRIWASDEDDDRRTPL